MKSIIRFLFMALTFIGHVAPMCAQEVAIPDSGLDAAIREALNKPVGPLTGPDLLGLTDLNAESRNISNLQGLEAARNLATLDLESNQLANLTLPDGLTNLSFLDLSFNPLGDCALPAGLTNLNFLTIEVAQVTNLTLPASLKQLVGLDLFGNRLTRLTLPADMNRLDFLDLSQNQFKQLNLPAGLTELTLLDAYANQLTSLTLPADMTNLVLLRLFFNQLTNLDLPENLRTLGGLDLGGNQLRSFSLSSNLTRLATLDLSDNLLTNVWLPGGLKNLNFLSLAQNRLSNLSLPSGLTNLTFLQLADNLLTSLTLPPDMTQLNGLFLSGNPLTRLVLSDPLATTKLSGAVAALRAQGISVFTYPLTTRLTTPRRTPGGAFEFILTGPPGIYTIFGSADLAAWNGLAVVTNQLGTTVITDVAANASSQKFYRALLLSPANMVFIPPNTFTMGSPTNDLDRSVDESPQTTVILTHGFWIGKYEVTEGEYLAVIGENPSNFSGDLNHPISSVSWMDATNYCAKLTQQELAAGRIPAGSRYRLPTEAEWECAARAGNPTRFSYGDDPFYTSLTNYAWFLDLAHPDLTVHPVGQKLPNSWGLHDMHGNVWEWCQDNYGALPGGIQIDPTGPTSTLLRDKVMRGGAYDYPNSSCRSASRLFRFPLWPDSDVGFRVVLVTGP